MKKSLFIIPFIIGIAALTCVCSCTKPEISQPTFYVFDTVVHMRFVIQVQDEYMFPQLSIQSKCYSAPGTAYTTTNLSNVISFPYGDTTHAGICSDTLHYDMDVKLSKSKPTDIIISMSQSGISGSSTTNSWYTIFTYKPASGKFTSTIYSQGDYPYSNNVQYPNTSAVLCPNTSSSKTCIPGTWILYLKYSY